jgi:bifunctional DNA-binding transcriptional regulator/antitoxin component of YhaV-PrlF toxin-antitoxin module
MLKIKLTTKRQATFPAKVCRALGVSAGDEVILEPRTEADGSTSWRLKPESSRPRSWLGSLNAYAKGKKHSLRSIRESIVKGRPARK